MKSILVTSDTVKRQSVKFREIKPDAMQVRRGCIPQAIRDINHWAFWRWERPGEKWTKPCVDSAGNHIQKNNKHHWGTFDAAYETYSKSSIVDGLGFTLGAGVGFVVIDLDNCRDRGTGELTDWALAVVKRFDS